LLNLLRLDKWEVVFRTRRDSASCTRRVAGLELMEAEPQTTGTVRPRVD